MVLCLKKTEHTSGEPIHDNFCWELWISSGLVSVVLKYAHDDPLASHGGVHKTLERLRRYYYWPGWVKDFKEEVEILKILMRKYKVSHTLTPAYSSQSRSG